MFATGRFRAGDGSLALGLAAAALSALVAHVAIDVVGDFVLARDAYDGIAHASRLLAALGLVAGSVLLALRFALYAFGDAVERRRLSLALAAPASPWCFVAAVVPGAVAMLLGMESLDALAGTGQFASFDDAFGGSPLLGLGLTVPIAMLFGFAGWRALRWLVGSHQALLRAIGSAFAVRIRRRAPRVQHLVPANVHVVLAAVPLRRAAKRGPPIFLLA